MMREDRPGWRTLVRAAYTLLALVIAIAFGPGLATRAQAAPLGSLGVDSATDDANDSNQRDGAKKEKKPKKTKRAKKAKKSKKPSQVLASGTLEVRLTQWPGGHIDQGPAPIPIEVAPNGSFSEPAGFFAGTDLLPTALFTGIPLISSLNLTAANLTGSFAPGGGPLGGFGGPEPLVGFSRVDVLKIFTVPVPLGVVGQGGTEAIVLAQLSVTVIGDHFTTGPARVTGATTTLTRRTPNDTVGCAPVTCGPGTTTLVSPTIMITVPEISVPITFGGGRLYANTITLSGYDNRTPGHAGTLLLVSPIKVITNAVGTLPGFAIKRFVFEPSSPELVFFGLAGAVMLALGGWRKRR